MLSLIKQINAKVVVTMIDNSYDFSIAAKYFENKIPFLAIQGANRGDIKVQKNEEIKKYFLDTFFDGFWRLLGLMFEACGRKNMPNME